MVASQVPCPAPGLGEPPSWELCEAVRSDWSLAPPSLEEGVKSSQPGPAPRCGLSHCSLPCVCLPWAAPVVWGRPRGSWLAWPPHLSCSRLSPTQVSFRAPLEAVGRALATAQKLQRQTRGSCSQGPGVPAGQAGKLRRKEAE